MKNIKTGEYGRLTHSTQYQFRPSIDGTRVIWEQRDSSHHDAIYYKNIATGWTDKVLKSTQNQFLAAISGTRIVWTQKLSSNSYSIYYKNLATGVYFKGTTLNTKPA